MVVVADAAVVGVTPVVAGELVVGGVFVELVELVELVVAELVVEHAPTSTPTDAAATNPMPRRTAAALRNPLATRLRS